MSAETRMHQLAARHRARDATTASAVGLLLIFLGMVIGMGLELFGH
jgi:hypothetical protein